MFRTEVRPGEVFLGKIVFLLAITFVILLAAIYVYIRLAGNQEKKYTPLRISLVFLISGSCRQYDRQSCPWICG